MFLSYQCYLNIWSCNYIPSAYACPLHSCIDGQSFHLIEQPFCYFEYNIYCRKVYFLQKMQSMIWIFSKILFQIFANEKTKNKTKKNN